jgi:hypothetical protein
MRSYIIDTSYIVIELGVNDKEGHRFFLPIVHDPENEILFQIQQ